MLNFVKGAIIGIALVIPGLSGSIFAVVVGLYDRLLNAVNHFRDDPKKNMRFLTPIGLGAVIGIRFPLRRFWSSPPAGRCQAMASLLV